MTCKYLFIQHEGVLEIGDSIAISHAICPYCRLRLRTGLPACETTPEEGPCWRPEFEGMSIEQWREWVMDRIKLLDTPCA